MGDEELYERLAQRRNEEAIRADERARCQAEIEELKRQLDEWRRNGAIFSEEQAWNYLQGLHAAGRLKPQIDWTESLRAELDKAWRWMMAVHRELDLPPHNDERLRKLASELEHRSPSLAFIAADERDEARKQLTEARALLDEAYFILDEEPVQRARADDLLAKLDAEKTKRGGE